ncbi:MAG: hypothetical protein ACOYMV_03790, partial [Verrucomicrobiia bacterium]
MKDEGKIAALVETVPRCVRTQRLSPKTNPRLESPAHRSHRFSFIAHHSSFSSPLDPDEVAGLDDFKKGDHL